LLSNLSIIGRYLPLPDMINHPAHFDRGTTPLCGMRCDVQRLDCGDNISFFKSQITFALQQPEMATLIHTILRKYQELSKWAISFTASTRPPSANTIYAALWAKPCMVQMPMRSVVFSAAS
jgi:hypothetical protein